MTKTRSIAAGGIALMIGLAGCTNPYDPGQRAVGGAVIGAGAGALIGGAVAGGRGAAIGAATGGALGAIQGAATTPPPPPRFAYRGCGPGGHWVRAHYNRFGHRVRGHCAPIMWRR